MADNGDPYIGAGGSFSDADSTSVNCRASGNIIGGIKFHSKLLDMSIESRLVSGFAGDYTSASIFAKPQIEDVYLLIGYGRTEYDNEKFYGGRYGAGYDLDGIFVDVIYNEFEEDTMATIGYIYRF
ncbi:MAG: hypothetical protein U9Q38_02485 [Thermodesulfobacteriota bacterium]|nr:hypothetical protein [Thermodesulfobacteriota bacterium]